jgi:hypothetical protein
LKQHTWNPFWSSFATPFVRRLSCTCNFTKLNAGLTSNIRQAWSLNNISNTDKGKEGGFDMGGSQILPLITSDNPAASAPPSPIHTHASPITYTSPAGHAPLPHPDALPIIAYPSPLTDAPVPCSDALPIIAYPLPLTDAPQTVTAGALPPHSSASTPPSEMLPLPPFFELAASLMSTVGNGDLAVGAFDFGLLNLDLLNPPQTQSQLDWPTLQSFTGEFNKLFSGHGSLMAELNNGFWAGSIPSFDPRSFIAPSEPTFEIGAFTSSPQNGQHHPEPNEVPLCLDAFPIPAPAHTSVHSVPPITLPPLAVSWYSGHAIVPSTHANKMNNIGSLKSTPTTDLFDSNKENHPPGTIQEPLSWLLAAEAYLTTNKFGIEWTDCIKAWRAFEAHLGYSNKKPMPCLNLHPEEWTNWIAKGCNSICTYDQTPHIVSPLKFGIAVMRWWRTIQLSFCKSTDSPMPLPIYDDAEELNCWHRFLTCYSHVHSHRFTRHHRLAQPTASKLP